MIMIIITETATEIKEGQKSLSFFPSLYSIDFYMPVESLCSFLAESGSLSA